MKTHFFTSWYDEFKKDTLLLNERRLVVLSGSEQWALSLLESIGMLFSAAESNHHSTSINSCCFIYGESKLFPANVQKKSFRDKLGSECDTIIFTDSQFSIDAFAALSGTLKAGGIFFLVVPEIGIMHEGSLFLNRFYSLIEAMSDHVFITQKNTKQLLQVPNCNSHIQKNQETVYPFDCITKEQYSAVKAIEKVVTGHRKRPLVLTADRGRGKSSALAIACAQLMKAHEEDNFSIIITAPDAQALTVFYQQLGKSLPEVKPLDNSFTFGKATLTFMAVDQLLKLPNKTNLLLVDEAAAIPVYLLEQLLNRYHRMVFSSTVHGYEGAGRGFSLKFQLKLDKICPQWQKLHIKQPVRWRDNDPLEQLVFDACLLNAELPALNSPQQDKDSDHTKIRSHKINSPVFKLISASELVADEALLKQVFAVLVTAHYQTKPSDLQLLLDNPHVQVTCLFASDKKDADIIAVALLMNEGASNGVEDADISAIKNSQRRLRNQFLPQSLLSHCGFEQAFDYHYLRIMRIAVHPQLQQQGIGTFFITQIETLAREQGVDVVGTSFGANASLLSFWLKAGFSTTRIGFTKDKSSGEHSALLIKGINVNAQKTQQLLEKDFYRSFDYLLLEEYKTLNSELVRLLLVQQSSEYLTKLSTLDIANVLAFSQGERLYSSCSYSLYLWLKHDLLINSACVDSHLGKNIFILIARLIQKHDSKTVCQQYDLTGKKMLNQGMQAYVRSRLKIEST
jgi:tRNA(Met) cytidine acetyltransferase